MVGNPKCVDNFTKKAVISVIIHPIPEQSLLIMGMKGKRLKSVRLDGKKEIHLRNLEVKVERILPECCF